MSIAFALVIPGAAYAAPQTPQVSVLAESVSATEATVEGVLNPGGPGELGDTYEFVFRAASTECKGTGETATVASASLGAEHEGVSARLEGLTQNTRYTVCLVVRNAAEETAASAPVTFKTALPPEVPADEEATGVTGGSVTLRGVLNPNAEGDPGVYAFRYRPSPSECEGPGQVEVPSEGAASGGQQGEVVEQTVTGLAPATTYTFCLGVRNAAFESALGEPVTFTTPAAAPTVRNEEVVRTGPDSATVAAEVNPGGVPANYQVEYVSERDFKVYGWAHATISPVPGAVLPAATEPISARIEITGLTAGADYEFRFTAHNQIGGAAGPGTLLHTTDQGGPEEALPDQRKYEVASGADALGEVYVPEGFEKNVEDSQTQLPFRASADGNAVAYIGDTGNQGGNGLSGSGNAIGNQYVATREPQQQRWVPKVITPQVAAPEEAELGVEYQGLSSDLGIGVLGAATDYFAASTHPEGPRSCEALYVRNGEAISPLFTKTQTPGRCGMLPPGGSEESPSQNLLFAGGNEGTATVPNYSELLFQSRAPLTSEASEASENEGGANLYVSVGSTPRLVSVLPTGLAESDAVFGAAAAVAGSRRFDLSNVISADGANIFWTDLSSGIVYVRKHAAALESSGASGCLTAQSACTVAVSSGPAKFWTATSDGRYVFYTENGQLWRFDTTTGSRESLAREGMHGEPAGILGVIGTSTNGEDVYVAAEGALAPGAEQRKCTEARVEQENATNEEERTSLQHIQLEEENGRLPAGRGCNLYLLRGSAGATFVAAVPAKDDNLVRRSNGIEDVPLGIWQPDLGSRTAEVTASGLGLVFESTTQLTGYENSSLKRCPSIRQCDPTLQQESLEVFLYHLGPDGGHIICVSCDPRNAAPTLTPAGEDGEINELGEGSTYLPVSLSSTYMRRWISESETRVFFNTRQPLVERDANGVMDVYEWEAEGTPSCPTATSVYGGCVFLISGGQSRYRSHFIDASVTGDDVFFTHRGQLGNVGSSVSKNDLYDARVEGGFSAVSQGCGVVGCKPEAPESPAFVGPPTVTAREGGNVAAGLPKAQAPTPKRVAGTKAVRLARALRACRRKRHGRQRKRCEQNAKRLYGVHGKTKKRPAKARKESSKRGRA